MGKTAYWRRAPGMKTKSFQKLNEAVNFYKLSSDLTGKSGEQNNQAVRAPKSDGGGNI